MAIYHLHVSKISRGEGRSATAAAAYRSGEKIRDERTKETHDYTKKKGIESKELVLPGGRKEERGEFWNRVELHHKRGDAIVAREIEVSLPAELPKWQRRVLVVRYAQELAQRYGVAADVAIHQPSRKGDQRNHHAHIMLSACQVGPDGKLGKKAAELDPIHCQRQKIESLVERERPRWAELVNNALELNQEKSRIDHRTLQAQGINREPTRHRGPHVTGIERKTGELSRIAQEHAQQARELEQARLAREQAERERREREKQEQARLDQEQQQREKEAQEKVAQEKAKQLQEQAAKAREELLAKAREATEKRRQELEKAATKAPEPSRTPAHIISAWKGPSSKPALPKPPGHLEDIERKAKDQEQAPPVPQLRQEEPPRPQQAPPTKESSIAVMRERATPLQPKPQESPQTAQEEAIKNREALLARAREASEKRRQELAQAAKVASTPKAQEQAPAPAQAKPREQSPAPPTPGAKPLDVAAGLAASRERFAQMRAEQERIKAEQERAQKQKEQEQKKDKGRGGPER